MNTAFPSEVHRAALLRTLIESGYSALLEQEKWCYHAYDYAWRRMYLNNYNRFSPIDTTGRWYDPVGVNKAFALLEKRIQSVDVRVQSQKDRVAAAYRWTQAAGKIMPAGVPNTDPRIAHLLWQYEHVVENSADVRVLNELRTRITGDGKNTDGSPSTEAIAFVTVAANQIRANINDFVVRSRAAIVDVEENELRALQEMLGVSAKPHEDSNVDHRDE